MRRLLVPLLASLSGLAGAAPLAESAACREALAALQAQEAKLRPADAQASGPRERELLNRLEPWRRQAARACLGGRGDPPPPTHSVASPAFTLPATGARPTPAPPTPPVPALPVPQRADTVPTVTNCDAAGCWTNDGSRLQRLGPNLVGPRGVCTVQGALLHCP